MSASRKTVAKSVSISGKGIHSGRPVSMILHPAEEDEGIVFERTDIRGSEPIRVSPENYSEGPGRRTILTSSDASVETTEHFLAALWALGISDIRVEIDAAELPILDGSSRQFMELIAAAGEKLKDAEMPVVQIKDPVFVSGELSAVLVLPSDHFRITYTLDYPHPLLRAQTYSSAMNAEVFTEEIAAARTFCTQSEAQLLLAAGFGKGATTDNTLIVSDSGPLENRFLWPDECARHKVLDLIGDLAVLGAGIKGHVIAVRSGHKLNQKLVCRIMQQSGSYV